MMREDERAMRRRVKSSSDGADDSFVLSEEQIKLHRQAALKDRGNPLLVSLIWMAIGGFLYFYFDLQNVLLFDNRISSSWAKGSGIFFGISVGTGAVCVVSQLVFKIDYEKRLPWAIPLATITGLLTVVGYIVTFYPVFGLFSIPIIIACSISFVLTLGTLPSMIGL
eukprot:m.22064 g.22064  ORF g.22064 m.22064 type:complete len:167 (+) comp9229_c0_seq1:166-666(+)